MNIASVAPESRRHLYSADEWEIRVDLAACYRLVAHFSMADMVYTHITAAVPGPEEHFLINPYGMMFEEVTASTLVKVDLDGNLREDTVHEINPAGYVIHSAVHAARHDVKCVIHTHSRAACAVSAFANGLEPMDQQSMQFYGRVAYHEAEGFALDRAERERLVTDLADNPVMILRNHGLLACGKSVGHAFRLAYYLERACRLQLDVMATGAEVHLPPDAVREHTAAQWEAGAAGIGVEEPREWPALLRMLDRRDPGYRD